MICTGGAGPSRSLQPRWLLRPWTDKESLPRQPLLSLRPREEPCCFSVLLACICAHNHNKCPKKAYASRHCQEALRAVWRSSERSRSTFWPAASARVALSVLCPGGLCLCAVGVEPHTGSTKQGNQEANKIGSPCALSRQDARRRDRLGLE